MNEQAIDTVNESIQIRKGSLWEASGFFLDSLGLPTTKLLKNEIDNEFLCVFTGQSKGMVQFFNQALNEYFTITGAMLKTATVFNGLKLSIDCEEGEQISFDTDI